MKASQAINKALKVFEKSGKGAVRTVEVWEVTGTGNRWTSALIHIGYAVNGDYTESDANPYTVNVYEKDGKIYAEER